MYLLSYLREKQRRAEYERAVEDAKYAFTTRIMDDGIYILCDGICIKTLPMTMTYEDVEKILSEYRECAINQIKKRHGKK